MSKFLVLLLLSAALASAQGSLTLEQIEQLPTIQRLLEKIEELEQAAP